MLRDPARCFVCCLAFACSFHGCFQSGYRQHQHEGVLASGLPCVCVRMCLRLQSLLPAAGAWTPPVFWRVFLSLLTVLRVHRWAILGTEPWHPGPAGKILALISPRLLSGRATALWGISQGCQEKESKKGELRLHRQPGGFHVNLRGKEQRETGYRKWKKQWISPNTARCSLLLVRCGACFVGQLFLGGLSSCDSTPLEATVTVLPQPGGFCRGWRCCHTQWQTTWVMVASCCSMARDSPAELPHGPSDRCSLTVPSPSSFKPPTHFVC